MNHKNELQSTLNYCRQCGDLELIQKILITAKSGKSLRFTINTFSVKDAARKQRNIYKVLRWYPEIKPQISLKVNENELTISIGMKIEKRGRRRIF